MNNLPKTLLEIVKYFSDEKVCVEFIASLKWEDGKPHCPKCGSDNCIGLKTRPTYQCKEQGCRKQFSVKAGTIFENCNVPLTKFLPCFWLLACAKNGISSCELSRALGVTQKTAWFMLHRVRETMGTEFFQKLSGEIEADETYVGGRTQFMHKTKREAMRKNRRVSQNHKTVVMGVVQRGGEVRAQVVENARRHNIVPVIYENVEAGASVYTDKLSSYDVLSKDYNHGTVDHSITYVNGSAHTNTLEGFWNLFKRSVKGTYTKIAPFHTDGYLNEQTWRYNNRKMNDVDRFLLICSQVFGKRLTYTELTGAKAV
jgi:transposase-like protein